MTTLTRSDVQYIVGALNNAARSYAESIQTVHESGLKRIYAMQMERNQALAAALQSALDKGAKRIEIK